MDDANWLQSLEAHGGLEYGRVLQSLHANLKPKTYLEIGVQHGVTLALASCPSVGIDPNLTELLVPILNGKPQCHLMQMTSDEFFRNHDPVRLLGQPIDLSFLDDMHCAEFLLRDFINVEKSSRCNSIVALHDCLPVDSYVARRLHSDSSGIDKTAMPEAWAGEVWKALVLIARERPDLSIFHLNSPPTGLVLITGLDPHSTVLEDRYFRLLEHARVMTYENDFVEYLEHITVLDSGQLVSPASMAQHFWF